MMMSSGDMMNKFLNQNAEEFYLNVTRGLINGWSVVHKFGKNSVVGTTFEPVCASGFYRTPTTLTSLEILSSSANDTSNGTGARTVTITGIGANYEEITETVTLNGTTPVALANQYYRIYRWYVATSGTYATQLAGSHAGNLTIRVAGGGDTWTIVDEVSTFPRGQSQIGAYTIPAGKRGYVKEVTFNIQSTLTCDIALFSRSGIDVVSAPFTPMRLIAEANGATGFSKFEITSPLGPIPEKTDIGVMARATAGTAIVSVDFTIYLEDI